MNHHQQQPKQPQNPLNPHHHQHNQNQNQHYQPTTTNHQTHLKKKKKKTHHWANPPPPLIYTDIDLIHGPKHTNPNHSTSTDPPCLATADLHGARSPPRTHHTQPLLIYVEKGLRELIWEREKGRADLREGERLRVETGDWRDRERVRIKY